MSEYLAIAQQSVADGYSPIFKVQTISLLAVSVSGEGTWQLEASLDKVRWLKLLDTDASLETFSADGSPTRFNVEKYRFARVIVAGSSGANKLNAKGLTTSASGSGGGSGTVTGASNLAGDEGVFAQLTGATLEFKSLTAGTGVTLSSDANAITINAPTTTGVTELTFVENKNAQQQINQSIRQSLDGYAVATSVTGLEQTEIEHYVQHSEAFGSVLQALDGYALLSIENQRHIDTSQQLQDIRNAIDGDGYLQNTTFQENKNAQQQINQSVLQALDGYFVGTPITGATNLGLGEVIFAQQNGTTLEFKSIIAGTNITLTPGSDSLTIDATSGDSGVSELTFQQNKNAQYQVNESIIKALDGYVEPNDPIVAIGAATDGYGGNFTGGSTNGHGLIAQAAGDGYAGIFKATTGYAGFFESNIDTPDRSTIRIVPQTLEPVAALSGDLYMHATSANTSKLVAWDGSCWNRYIPIVYRNEGSISTTSTSYPNKIFNFTVPAGALRKGSTIGIEYWGQQTNGAPSGNVTAELYFNSTLAATTTLHAALSNTRFNVRLNMIILTNGASGTATFGGFASIGASAADGTMANFSNTGLAIDTTVTNTISPAFYIQTTATMQMDGLIITIT